MGSPVGARWYGGRWYGGWYGTVGGMIGAQGTVVDGGGRCGGWYDGRCGGWYGGGRHYLFLGLLALRHECLELLSPLHVGVDLLADRLLCPLVFVICMMSHNAARDDDASEDGERGSENRSENGAHAALRLGRPKKKKKEKKKEKKSKLSLSFRSWLSRSWLF